MWLTYRLVDLSLYPKINQIKQIYMLDIIQRPDFWKLHIFTSTFTL